MNAKKNNSSFETAWWNAFYEASFFFLFSRISPWLSSDFLCEMRVDTNRKSINSNSTIFLYREHALSKKSRPDTFFLPSSYLERTKKPAFGNRPEEKENNFCATRMTLRIGKFRDKFFSPFLSYL